MLATQVEKETFSRSMFLEALFVHGLRVDPQLRVALKDRGFDLFSVHELYPRSVFVACVDAACEHLFPELPLEEAQWEMGRRLTRGASKMLWGKVLLAPLPMLGPMRFLRRIQHFANVDIDPFRIRHVLTGERSFRLEFQAPPDVSAMVTAGVIDEALRLTRVEPKLAVEDLGASGFVLHGTWSPLAAPQS